MGEEPIPGEILPGEGTVTINEGRETATVRVANAGDRPVQVGSHFHFFEANPALAFDRRAAFGKRLNVPAGTAVRFEPGDERTVELVAFGGKRRVHGLNGLTNGSVDGDPEAAMERARAAGFVADDSDVDDSDANADDSDADDTSAGADGSADDSDADSDADPDDSDADPDDSDADPDGSTG